MRRVSVVLACIATLLTVAACGSDIAESSQTTRTVTETPSSTRTVDRLPAQTSVETTHATTASDTITATITRPTIDQVPRSLTAADATVSADDFYYDPSGNVPGHYFRSPSGNVECGRAAMQTSLGIGCSAKVSVRNARGPVCGNTNLDEYSEYFYLVGGVGTGCVTNSAFGGLFYPRSGPPSLPRILEYGQVVSIDGTTCASTTAGITCFDRTTGFTLARDRNEFR